MSTTDAMHDDLLTFVDDVLKEQRDFKPEYRTPYIMDRAIELLARAKGVSEEQILREFGITGYVKGL